jgi:hypothetical protein
VIDGAAGLVAAVARGLAAMPRPVAVLATVAWMGLVFALSSGRRDLLPPGWLSSLVNNAGHAAIYGVLALLAARAAGSGPRAQWAGFALAVLYGATDEWHQSQVPGRTASPIGRPTRSAGRCGLVAAVGRRESAIPPARAGRAPSRRSRRSIRFLRRRRADRTDSRRLARHVHAVDLADQPERHVDAGGDAGRRHEIPVSHPADAFENRDVAALA